MPEERTPGSHAPLVWLPLFLLLAALVFRVLGQHRLFEGWPNLSPLMALAFTGAVLFPRPLPWWSWAVVLLSVDAVSQGTALWRPENLPVILLTYVCYIAAACWGGRMRPGAGIVNTLVGTLTCSVLFYLVTNTFCWATEPSYTKSFAGWVQCLTTGTPGLTPTWMFFRNSLIADFTGACVLLMAYNGEALLRGLRLLPWMNPREESPATA